MAGEAAKGTMGIFIVFVLSRALHPMVIDYSKVDGKMLYSKNSPAIMSFLTRKTNKGGIQGTI
jgi:hypothetical protein